MQALKRFFRIEENQTTLCTETRAGIVTFMAMAYIIFVQPIILSSAAGLDTEEAMGSGLLISQACSALNA